MILIHQPFRLNRAQASYLACDVFINLDDQHEFPILTPILFLVVLKT